MMSLQQQQEGEGGGQQQEGEGGGEGGGGCRLRGWACSRRGGGWGLIFGRVDDCDVNYDDDVDGGDDDTSSIM